MKYLYLIAVLFFMSCKEEENVKIINQNLVSEITSFIKDVDKNSPCKSDYITIRIFENKIRMANYQPELSEDFIGMIEFDMSKIYFFSSYDYSKYVKITHAHVNENYIKKKIKSKKSCDPPMYKILIIDKNDKGKFHIFSNK